MAEPPLAVEREVIVDCVPERAFAVWTEGIHLWWPLAGHSIGGADAVRVAIEPGVGGRILEVGRDGQVSVWGTVLEWDPPDVLRHTWHLGADPVRATEVEVRFAPHGDGRTRVALRHTGFERFGADADRRRDGNARGWAAVTPSYGAFMGAATPPG